MTIKPFAATILIFLACACTKSQADIQAEAEAAVRAQLRNPTAATFERIQPCTNSPGIMGVVASPEFADTDGFGSFVYAEGEAVLLRSESSRYPELVRACTGRQE